MTGVMVLRGVHTFPSFPPSCRVSKHRSSHPLPFSSSPGPSAASLTSLSPFWVCSELMSWSLKYEQLGERGN